MDYDNDSEMWDWHGEGYCLQKETNLDISPCLWDGVSQNEEDLSYMFDETTPVKACGDLAYHVADNVNMDKELQQCTEMSSQVKRRRMLQFDNEILGSPLCNEEISSVFLKSKVRDLVEASNMYGTLNNVLDVDVKNDTVRTQGSLSCNLRRVRQGLDLIRAIFENFLSSEGHGWTSLLVGAVFCVRVHLPGCLFAMLCAIKLHQWETSQAL